MDQQIFDQKMAALDNTALIAIMDVFIELNIRPKGGFPEYPKVIRELVKERDRLKAALEEIAEIMPFTNEDAADMRDIARFAIQENTTKSDG